MKTLGERIKELREMNGLTQQELGKELFVSDKAVSKWETDKNEPEVGMLVKMAEIFHISMDYLTIGENGDKRVEILSKIEIACKEDNLALLDGIDLDSVDINGKDINYYANKYHASSILKYLDQLEVKKFNESSNTKKDKKFLICAIPNGLDGLDNLVFLKEKRFNEIIGECKKIDLASTSFEETFKQIKDDNSLINLDKEEGYHSYTIFYEKEFYEKCNRDYQYLDINVLDQEGKHKISLNFSLLNDENYASLSMSIFDYGKNKVQVHSKALVKPNDVNDFLKVLKEVDFKNWENKSWGYPVYEMYYALKKKEDDKDLVLHNKYYVAPPRDKYMKFTKAIEILVINSMKPRQYKKFIDSFNNSFNTHYRQSLSIFISDIVFSEIEKEQEFIKNHYGHPF